MKRECVYHICTGTYAYASGKYTLNVRLKCAKGDLKGARVHYMNVYDHTLNRRIAKMRRLCSDEYSDLFEAELSLPERHFKYFFELDGTDEHLFFTADGFLEGNVENKNSFFFPVINEDEIPHYPAWAKGALIYQIFVDRFFSSERRDRVNRSWEELPDRASIYGGDFDGIVEKLDYIRGLGAEVIYLCPVFRSQTNHKYDIEDYYAIDEMFGGEDALLRLVNAVHAAGMRLILDCVFNHMSSNNAIFRDVVERGEKSRYKDWFYIYSYPVDPQKGNYDTFAGCVPSMPRMNTSNPEVIEYLVGSAVFWTKKLGIDGWRLDVADEVSVSLWRRFREEIAKVNPDALIVGEIWNHATKWMGGDQMHTVTNYKYRKWLLDFIGGKIGSELFWQKTAANDMLYITPCYDYLINLLGSHDTGRIAEEVGPERAALALLMTLSFRGMPLIYYGDELGLAGGEDPDNRRTMPWQRATEENTAYVSAFSRLRREYADIFKCGTLEPLPTAGESLAFERASGGRRLKIIVNFGKVPCEACGTQVFAYNAETKCVTTEERNVDCIGGMTFAVCK